MTSLNQDDNEQVLRGYDDVEWVDDVAQYQCTRCQKVLVNHYISNCQHKFCSNCKRILDDGSHRWKCSNCQQFIVDMDGQDFEFKARVNNLRLHCPNRKYGCQHTCRFKNLKEHLEGCENTRERALPVLYEGELTTQMLERMFTMEMLEVRREMAEMKQTILELKDRDKEEKGVREGSWDLSVEVNEISQRMTEMEKKQQGAKENQATNCSLAVEENKNKILKLEGKAESYLEMIEFNNRKNNELMQRLRAELEKELKIIEMKIREDNIQNANSENEKLERVVAKEEENSEIITKLSEKIDILNRDLLNNHTECIGQVEQCLAALRKVNDETDKVGKTSEESKSEVERMKREIQKNFKEHSETVIKMEQNMKSAIASIEMRMKTMEENGNTEAEKVENQEKNTETPRILLSPNLMREYLANPLPLSLPNIPQLTCLHLVTPNHIFQPAFTWKARNASGKLQPESTRWLSERFTWPRYPIESYAEILPPVGVKYLTLTFTNLNRLKLFPTVYYVLKDQSGNVKDKSLSKSCLFAKNLGHSIDFTDDLSNDVPLKRSFQGDLMDQLLYNKDNSVVFEIYIEPPTMLQQVYSYDGILNWAIDQYGRRKQLAEEQLVLYHESPYFYTGPKGYRVQVLMFLDGYVDNELGVRAKIMFLRGEFDKDLPKTFAHSTTVTLIDKRDPTRNVSVTEKKNFRADVVYSMAVCSDKKVKTLIENDTLYYNVTIK